MKPFRPRPVQCVHCARYGHTTACVFPERCLRCGGQHCTTSCEQRRPRCFHCGGPHPANNPRCARWQEERKVATLVAAAPSPLLRQARATVRAKASRTTTINGPVGVPAISKRNGRSYAAITCGSSALGSESFTRQKLAAGALDLVPRDPAGAGARRRRRNRKASIKPSHALVTVAQTAGRLFRK
ncbi:hypothetical protein HPB49_017614 [Dermacentor silvarum]|uniref:Uncharacterized protein n=1 Tax=Dermacentor silvarum TaxID=543639 RepID=A0ACB8D709_DERSI|nr:hypothetical protein HPB49_017614 [Dermacentor silvarum]